MLSGLPADLVDSCRVASMLHPWLLRRLEDDGHSMMSHGMYSESEANIQTGPISPIAMVERIARIEGSEDQQGPEEDGWAICDDEVQLSTDVPGTSIGLGTKNRQLLIGSLVL